MQVLDSQVLQFLIVDLDNRYVKSLLIESRGDKIIMSRVVN